MSIIRKLKDAIHFGRGVVDYLFFYKKYLSPWGSAFNDQQIRKQIYNFIIKNAAVKYIIETGTYRGTTTEYMQENSGLEVDTVEYEKRYYMYSKLRFKKNKKINIYLNDSKAFLEEISSNPKYKDEPVFIYLDAHWYLNFPLQEELKIVFSTWKNAIVMIDDFCVPNDKYYQFDTFNGLPLDIHLSKKIENELKQKWFYFFPVNGIEETGFKRGCIIITKNPALADILKSSDLVFEWK